MLVTVEYEVDSKKTDEFLEALHKFARVRRRDGASRWGVYRDTEHPAHYVETFIVESWAEHLRQHERLTSADRELEENVGRFESKPIQVRISSMRAANVGGSKGGRELKRRAEPARFISGLLCLSKTSKDLNR